MTTVSCLSSTRLNILPCVVTVDVVVGRSFVEKRVTFPDRKDLEPLVVFVVVDPNVVDLDIFRSVGLRNGSRR